MKIHNKSRAILRSITLDILGYTANPSVGVHLLNSHLLSMDKDLDANFFDHQLKVLSRKSTIIPFEEAVDLIKMKKKVNHSLIAFSYDDGFAECYTHIAPVIEKYNGYACFFVNPNFINGDKEYVTNFLKDKVHLPAYKKPMNWNQITDLHNRGHLIGAHTMDHIRVSEMFNLELLHYQIGECKKVIESTVCNNCDYFAFTYGHPGRDFDLNSVLIAENYYKYIFSASNWRNYFSYNEKVLNRRHYEPYWNASHINYFLSKKISY
jgi:peptidoglycan/xylan/chitin deacetylase (PgdA/CDA1 family)